MTILQFACAVGSRFVQSLCRGLCCFRWCDACIVPVGRSHDRFTSFIAPYAAALRDVAAHRRVPGMSIVCLRAGACGAPVERGTAPRLDCSCYELELERITTDGS